MFFQELARLLQGIGSFGTLYIEMHSSEGFGHIFSPCNLNIGCNEIGCKNDFQEEKQDKEKTILS